MGDLHESNNIDNLENIFTNIFKEDQSLDLLSNGLEVSIDSILDEGLVKDIPIASTILSLFRMAKGYSDQKFLKKLIAFLVSSKSVTQEKKIEFIIELEDHTKEKAGEVIINFLERFDHVRKANILGNLVVARIEDKITIDDFLRLAHVIEKTFYYDLLNLKNYQKIETSPEYNYSPIIGNSLKNAGLVSIGSIEVGPGVFETFAGTPLPVRLTSLGKILISNAFL